MSLENFIITIFCLVTENVKKVLGEQRLRQRSFQPKLTDSGVIMMEIVG